MSKGSRLSRLLPKFFRGDSKSKDGQAGSDLKGPFCSIVFLDDTDRQLPYKNNSKGQTLFDQVCDMLDLLEKDYFGLRFVDDLGQAHWLAAHKSISSQLKGCKVPYKFYFGVKFYAADPCKLREEITRYLFFLQVKRDILQGRLPITFDEAAELCGYALQSELGDFDPRAHTAGYVSEFCFVPNQTEELEARIAGIHRRCVGATPIMAEHRFLEKVQWLEMYGVDLHPVQGESSVEYFLGLTPTGIVVYKHKSKVASYFWPRVTKASHKGKMFMLKVKDKNNEDHLYAFELSTKAACKHLWRCSVEHHAFFSGRSERLAAMESRCRQQPTVERAPSRRRARRVNSDSRINDQCYQDQYYHNGRGMVTVMGQPEPVRAPRHRSLPELHGRQSPRSVKSAPWESNYDYGLYTSGHDSPSAAGSRRDPRHASFVSGGSDSESGISQRKRYFPGRKGSDNESDGSASRRRRRERDSDSGSEVSFTMSNKGRKKRNPNQMEFKNFDSHLLYPFHDKENHPNGSIPSLHSAPAGELKQRRRRRRSKSPGNNKRPPEELKQHIEFDLVDTEGMTEDQLQDIAYTKVETKANLFRVKYSPKFRQKIWASRRKSFGDADRNSTPNRSNLTRQESYHTDPAGVSNRDNQMNSGGRTSQDLLVGGQQGYDSAGRMEEGRHGGGGRASDWSAASPKSERSGAGSTNGRGGGGYNTLPSSKAYHNPVYLGHRDAIMVSNARSNNTYNNNNNNSNGKSYTDGNVFNAEEQHGQTPDRPSQSGGGGDPVYGYHQKHQSRDFNQNRFSYKDQQQHQHHRPGPNSPGQGRANYASPGGPAHQDNYSGYNQSQQGHSSRALPHQSPYDADVSRLEDSRMERRMNTSTGLPSSPPGDGLKIESRGYGATLHRRSTGVPYSSGHVMNGVSPRQENPSAHYFTGQGSDPRSPYSSAMRPSDQRYSSRSSYGEAYGGVGSTPPRSSSRPSYNQQQSTPPRTAQPYSQDYSNTPSSAGHNYPNNNSSSSNNRSFNYAQSPSISQVPYSGGQSGRFSGGGSASVPTPGYSSPGHGRYSSGVAPRQQQQHQQQYGARDAYGGYSQQSPRPQGQPPPYARSPGNSRAAASMYPNQNPVQPASGNRPQQRAGYRSDLVTQL